MRIVRLPILLVPLLAACTVGPDHARPKVAGEAGAWTAPVSDGAFDPEPWRQLGDPLLAELVERAAAANHDVRQAEARLLEARAGRDAAAGARLPEAGINSSYSRRRMSENGEVPASRFPGIKRNYNLYQPGFDASWELDLWGGQRRAVEAADRRSEAAAAMAQETRLRVIAETVRAYAELREAQAEARLLQADADAQRELATLARQLYASGEVSKSTDTDADMAALQAQAAAAGTEARIRGAANAIAVLTGQPPEAVQERLLVEAPIPSPPGEVAPGLRSEVLLRRPDVMAAEAQLAAATADIGVEKAKLYPSLSLMGSIAQESRLLDDVAKAGSMRFGVGTLLRWPVFAGGRLKAQVRAADARAQGAVALYEQAVIAALADSETALNRYNAAVAAARALVSARERSAAALALAEARWRGGEDSMIDLLQARSRHYAASRATVSAQAQALAAHAMLVKALGGGWSPDSTAPALAGAPLQAKAPSPVAAATVTKAP